VFSRSRSPARTPVDVWARVVMSDSDLDAA
jgi:hypothetical protein